MKIEGTYNFAAPRDVVWPMLLDPHVLTRVMPGCEKLEQIGENKFSGVLVMKVGPVQGKFDGIITLSDIQAPESYHIDVDGKGPAGFVKGGGRLRLEADGDSMTLMHYEGDAQVGGKIASVGQRLLDTSAKAIIRQSLEGLGQQIQAAMMVEAAKSLPPEEAPPPPAPPQAPTQTQFALGVTKKFVEELVPAEQRADFLMKTAVILGGFILALIIGNWFINRIAHRIAQISATKGGE